MADAFAAVEAAIAEVARVRGLVAKKKAKQVYAGDEIDLLKSVAFAWFQTHGPIVATHPSRPDLAEVNAMYRIVMDATGRHAARKTYFDALFKAKRALVAVRGVIAAAAPVAAPSTTDALPNFAPLASDPKMQLILARRWDEVQHCITAKAYLSATVMMGGLLESLLVARINGSPNKPAVYSAAKAPRDKAGKTLVLADWKLIHMVEVAHELAWVTKSAKDVGNVLREFRNYIHPHKEYTDGVIIGEDDARMFWEVTKAITRQVLASVGKTP